MPKAPRNRPEKGDTMEKEVFVFPTSFAQQRMWFLDQWVPGSPVYIIPLAVRLAGHLRVAALEHSLNEIVRRHEALRTTFSVMDGQPVQVITPQLSLSLPVIDLRALPETERETEVRRLATAEAQQPFDLTQGPLLRATLLRLGEHEQVLLLTLHHIVADGWSIGILLRELVALYAAFCLGQPSPLPELPLQYADFAVWQRQWLQAERLEPLLAYWTRQLQELSLLELPTDRPRPAVQSYRGACQSLRLPYTLSNALNALSRREGVTLFMTLLAAFQTLLHRYTGQDDLVVGSPIAGRTRAETEGLIGFFVNTLVLRTDLSGNPTFRELLGRVRETALGAYAHQELPFERLVEELHAERNLSRTPLFQVMFVLQNVPIKSLELPELTASLLNVDNETAKFDLTVSLGEREDGISGEFEYNTDLFEATTIARMLGHWQTLLAGVVANPERRLSELPLLTEAERLQVLVEWNDTATDYPRDRCIHQLFEAQAEQTPDTVAVVCEGAQLTYGELNRRANQLAHYLRKHGVEPETLVGICIERSVEMIIGVLGILKAGGAYVPLDPLYPKERLAFILTDTQAPVLLTQRHLLPRLPDYKTHLVCLDERRDVIGRESEETPADGATADNLAYVTYTSGSTGRPKGACIPHRGVVRLVKGSDYVDLSPEEVFLQLAPLSFDASTFEIWGCLLNGARLVIFPPHVPTLAELGRALQQHRVTTLWLTAGLFHQMVESQPRGLGHVRQLLAGGDVLSVPHVKDALLQLGGGRLVNGYGPTESTTFTCCHVMTDPDQVGMTVPIGRPIANTQVYVLDRYAQPVPIGVPGELYIGGDGLACNYLNLPQLTAERFIPHPFSDKPEARLYRTGDRVRYRPDGSLEFLGRLDHQVKIRGFRIEPGEIEAVLGHHPAVGQTVVVAREDTPGDKRLVAYVVPCGGQNPTASDFRSFLQTKLPDYMVPSVFVVLGALPLTPNGKVDRRALPAPDRARRQRQGSFLAPRDPLELQLTKLWEELLGTEPVGVQDNFFELGGHSLLAVRFVAQIEKLFGKVVPLALLFQAPTVEQLAHALRREEWAASPSFLVPLQPGGSKLPFFCVYGYNGGGGNLRRYVDPNQPLYTLHHHGLNGRRAPSTTEDMASHYLKEIRSLQPTGPYFLGGFSAGGLIAFEMAQQLRKQGQEVALLVLFDPPKPGTEKFTVSTTSSHSTSAVKLTAIPSFLSRHWAQLRHLKPHEKFIYVLERIEGCMKWAEIKTRPGICRLYLRIGYRLPPHVRQFYALEVSRQIVREYRPQPYPGHLVLFKTANWLPDRQAAWERLAAEGIEIHEISGEHLEIFTEPHIQGWARQFGDYLRKAQITSRRVFPRGDGNLACSLAAARAGIRGRPSSLD
jgi:amino acid adenylation domain-containing protein